MAKKKRVTRKELLKEPDEFLTLSAKVIRFAADNQKQIAYATIGIVAVVLVFFLYQYVSARSERKAFALFQEGFAHHVNLASTPSADSDAVAREKFTEVIEKYGSTSAARLALPMKGDLDYRQGAYDEAIALYEKALEAFSKDQGFRGLMWNNLGYAYEGKKDYRSAVQWFQRLAESEGELMKADAYFNLGRMYEALNEKEKALEAYDKVAKGYPESVHAQPAREKVAHLEG
jgi:tetratricopeptide (TPR) repeat protein